jgi:ABC-type Fe3+ transport system permease subunit
MIWFYIISLPFCLIVLYWTSHLYKQQSERLHTGILSYETIKTEVKVPYKLWYLIVLIVSFLIPVWNVLMPTLTLVELFRRWAEENYIVKHGKKVKKILNFLNKEI